ncbi:MAG: methionine--tRNA ligase [Nitrososphaerota archaeon]
MIGSELSADIYARYLRVRGEDVVFVSGSDEHGTPIEVEAAKQGVEPKTLTDKFHAKVVEIFKNFGLSFDNYTRTHNPIHISFCQNFFKRIYENGYIIDREMDQLYCDNCRRFLPDRFVHGTCPYCGYSYARGDQCESCGRVLDPLELVNPICAICGSTPIIRSTRHWFLDLPQLSQKLKEWLVSNPSLSERVKAFSLSWIEEGLRPRAVTRDNKWGIPAPFPGAEEKTIYVWFEAVLGYISATVELGISRGEPSLWEKYWLDKQTRTVYFIGKDNIPFHTIILPALLLAHGEGYVLPWNVSATEYLTFEGQKFSKSKKIGVWLDEALAILPSDYWRYYLAKNRPETSDTNFRWQDFVSTVNSDLNDDIGNYIHRVLTFIHQNFEGKVPEHHALDADDERILMRIREIKHRIDELMDEVRERQSLIEVLNLVKEANSYLNLKEPWKLLKTDPKRAATTLFVASQIVAALTVFLEIFTPDTAAALREMIGLGYDKNGSWGRLEDTILQPNTKITKPKPLFRKVSEQEIMQRRERVSTMT